MTDFGGYAAGIRVHHLTPVEREQVILPDAVLELVDRDRAVHEPRTVVALDRQAAVARLVHREAFKEDDVVRNGHDRVARHEHPPELRVFPPQHAGVLITDGPVAFPR
mgnify:CR=1 FL=1